MTAETIPAEVLDECWRDLVEKTDRTSPEDYPDMALVTREELGAYLALAGRTTRPAEPAPEGEVKAWLMGDPATGQWIEIDGQRVEYSRGRGTPVVALTTAYKAERDRADVAKAEADELRRERAELLIRAEAAEALLGKEVAERKAAETALSRALQDREVDREVLSQAEAGLAAMLRLADMGLEESLSEPEENGNFAAYEEGKRCLDQVRTRLRADQRAEDGEQADA